MNRRCSDCPPKTGSPAASHGERLLRRCATYGPMISTPSTWAGRKPRQPEACHREQLATLSEMTRRQPLANNPATGAKQRRSNTPPRRRGAEFRLPRGTQHGRRQGIRTTQKRGRKSDAGSAKELRNRDGTMGGTGAETGTKAPSDQAGAQGRKQLRQTEERLLFNR